MASKYANRKIRYNFLVEVKTGDDPNEEINQDTIKSKVNELANELEDHLGGLCVIETVKVKATQIAAAARNGAKPRKR